ncbi:PilC/PilY family type IV pilus protein [Pseudomonadales bacterium]|nr:PilC/PilY family type IV pilus protein [Pseudomonadales bacterium]
MKIQNATRLLFVFGCISLTAWEAVAANISQVKDNDTAADQVLESALGGVAVGVTVKSLGSGVMSYAMNVDADGRFDVGETTGVVTTTGKPLDRETDAIYKIEILASADDGLGTDTAILKVDVAVIDVDDNVTSAISDTNADQNEVAENATAGKRVNIEALATDADATAVISYALTDDAGGRFQIDGAGRVATTGAVIDREAAPAYVITVAAMSTMGMTKYQDFTIAVLGVDEFDPDAVADVYDVAEGGTLVTTATRAGNGVLGNDTDADEPFEPLQVTLGTDVGFGTLSLNAGGDFTYTHNGDEVFVDSFTYKVADPNFTTGFVSVTLNILPMNDNVPVAADDNYLLLINEGGTLNGTTVLVNDTDADLPGDMLTAVLDTDASNGTLALASDGTFTYTHDGASEIFSDSFTYHVFDGVNSAGNGATVTISVNPLNDNKPVAVADATYEVDEGATLSVSAATGVINNDTDADRLANGAAMNTLTLVNGTSTSHGSLSLNADGSFIYTHDDSENLTDSFTYQAFDGTDTSDNTVTVNINVTPRNDNVPVITSDSARSVDENIRLVRTLRATDVDSTDTLRFTIVGGVDASLFEVEANTGIAVIASELRFRSSPDYEIPTDANGDNIYVVDVQVSDGINTVMQTLTITVLPKSDTIPTSSDKTIAMNEDGTYPFSVADFAYMDADGDDFVQVQVRTLPALGELAFRGSAVSQWDRIDVADIGDLTYMPEPDGDGFSYSSFEFRVVDSSGDRSVDHTMTIDVAGVADTPTLATAANITTDEDQAIDIGLVVSLVDGTREDLTVVIDVAPAGATLSDGANSASGASVDISSWNVSAITITPVLHDDTDIVLSIVAVATEVGNGDTATISGTTNVIVTAVADAPALTVTSPVTVDEDGSVGLTLAGSLVDTDGSETLSYQISGMPVGASLNQGVNGGAGIWNLTSADLTGLTVSTPANSAEDFTLAATALATEADDGGAAAFSGLQSIVVIVNGVADMPTVSASPSVTTNEDVATPALGIIATLSDPAEESLTVSVEGVPAGATLTDGSNTVIAFGATLDVTGWLLGDIYLVPPLHTNGVFTLTVNATATEDENASAQTASTDIALTIVAVNDAPSVVDQTFYIDENAGVGTVIGTVLASDIEPGQTLSYDLTGSAFAIDSNGIITVADQAQLDYETTATFNLTVTVTDSGLPALFDTAALVITLNPLNDNAPIGVADVISVDELGSVSINVLSNDLELDLAPSAPLTVTEVNGDMGLVGVAFPLEAGGVVAGNLTISADGSAVFVANTDPAVEIFSVSATYTVSDGTLVAAGVPVTLTINPINDNSPKVTAAGLDLAIQGLTYDEDEHLSAASSLSINLQNLFSDIDMADSLQFSISSNSNAAVVPASINAGNYLVIYSPTNEFGVADLVIEATDTANPSANVSSVSLSVTVSVNSVNDAPVYQAGTLPDISRNEDAGDLLIDLASAFIDADMTDSNGADDSLTYTVTIEDISADFVMTDLLDVSGLSVVSDLADTPVAESRQIILQTNDATLALAFNADAFGTLNVSVRATDQGRPPALPAVAVPLFAEAEFQVVIEAVLDDQPIAVDDHYNSNPSLVVLEDSEPIDIYVIGNDYQGDVPASVINAGQSIKDSFNVDHSWRSTSRLADDPFNPGNLIITMNGEVVCAAAGCAPTGNSIVNQAGVDTFSVRYMPMPDFNGEDVFTYCIQDASSVGEAAFTPPNDSRCAQVTINVLPQNDLPSVSGPIYFFMDQAGVLQLDAAEGLLPWVHDVDNSHRDGLGCDPSVLSCPTLPQPDQLYFRFTSAVTTHGQLLPPYNTDGGFTYQPEASFDGQDSFTFDVCDVPLPGDTGHCIYGVEVLIVVNPIDGAPEGAGAGVVEYDYQLADAPLELPIGPEPNVLIIEDDSRSMEWDLSTSSLEGVFYFPQRLSTQKNRDSSDSLYWVMAASATDSWSVENSKIVPTEDQFPGQGFWTLRSSSENKIYYDPTVQYRPWDGLDTSDQPFPNSPPTAAKHYPWLAATAANTTDLTLDVGASYTGRALEGKNVCVKNGRCVRYDNKGKCKEWVEVCSTEYELNEVSVNGFYIPRHYVWEDKNNNGKLDYTPSPNGANPDSEGRLVEIRPANAPFPKSADRTDCITAETTCSYGEELQNFANWFTYARTRELTAKMALGRVVAKSESLRMGYSLLNNDNYNRKIISMNTSERTGAKAALLDSIYLSPTLGGTPLRVKLRDAGRHYACEKQDIFGSNQPSALGAVDAQGYADCPILPAPAGNCQQNFTLMITDGTWSGNQPPNIRETDNDNDTNFDGDIYAGAPSDTLADVAMYYYEYDLHPALSDQVATNSRDKAGASTTAFAGGGNDYMHQHMTTYTIGFGAKGFITAPPTFSADTAGTFDWGDPMADARTPAKIDDLRHAAFNGRGEYLDASSVKELTQALTSAFEEFSQGSGTASAVSFNSQEVQAGTLIFRAFYNTKTNAGNLVAQGISDTGLDPVPVWEAAKTLDAMAATDRQIITLDRISNTGIKFRPETLNAEQRKLFITDPGASDAVKLEQITERVNYLRGDASLERPFGDFRERPVTGGRLGDLVHSAPVFVGSPDRLRRTLSPYPQDAPYATFKSEFASREKVVYVAANDGMLHGFDANNGRELIAYVPDNLMLGKYSRKITELLDYRYSHRFLVDLTPALNDVFMDADLDGDREWTTLMIGGQGAGGKAYFGLNVTDPTKFSEATAADVALWEFTDADDSYPTAPVTVDETTTIEPLTTGTGGQRRDLQTVPQPVKDLGYSFSVPTIVMSNLKHDGENEWVAILGNGYNSTAGIAKLFVLLVDHGADGTWCHPDMIHNTVLNGDLPEQCIGKQDFVKIDTGFGAEGGYPNGLGTPRAIDTDGNGTVDYAYAGDTFGNFYRFDLRSDNFAEWTSTKIFKAEYTAGVGQAITSQPIVTPHPTQDDGYLVIFGTGSYVTVPDGADTSIQSIYGLWDRLGPELVTTSQMVQQSYTNLVDPTYGPFRRLSSNPVDYVLAGGKRGWYIHLDAVPANGAQGIDPPEFPGERAVRNIQLRGDVAFVNSVIPRGIDSCIKVDGGFGLAFCPSTGGANCFAASSVFDLNEDGVFDDGDRASNVAVAGIRFEDAVPSDSAFIGAKRVTQLSDQSLNMTLTNTQQGVYTGRLSWKQLDSVD